MADGPLSVPPPRGAVGHADLARLFGRADCPCESAARALLADLLGLEPVPAPAPTADLTAGAAPRQPPLPVSAPAPSPRPVSGLPFYRVTEWRQLPRTRAAGEPPPWWGEAQVLPTDPAGDQHRRPRPAPLTPWRQCWPLLRAALGAEQDGHAPDLRRLLALAARARMPRRLPRRRRLHWAGQACLFLDLSPHLEPIHDDLRGLIDPLLRLRGAAGLRLLLCLAGAAGPFRVRLGADRWPLVDAPELPSRPGTPVLVVGDLGCYAGAAERAAWVALGQRLRRVGCRPVALIAAPPRLWHPDLAGLYLPIPWDRHRRLPATLPGAAGPSWPGAPPGLASDPGANHLLDLVAPTLRLEPALLRALRLALRAPGLDLGAELAAWNHPDLSARGNAHEWADRATRARRQQGWRDLPEVRQRQAAELIQCHSRHLPRSITAEEAATLARLRGQTDPQATAALADLARTLDGTADPSLRERLGKQAGRLGERLPADGWQDEALGAWWVIAHREELSQPRGGPRALPPGLDLNRYDWLLAGPGAPRVAVLVQQGEGLRVTGGADWERRLPAGPGSAGFQPASPVTPLALTATSLQYAPLTDPDHWSSLPATTTSPIPLTAHGLRLRGHDAEVTIEAMTRPDWAEAIGRDGAGLYCEIAEGAATRRLCWVPPGPSLWPAADPAIRDRVIPHGAWWDAAVYAAWLRGDIASAPWAARTGWDKIGLWAEVDGPGGVTQRLRWLWPGGFLMGSPEQEPERELYGLDETRHAVLLTRGLWLADTACTQALWQAVMGDNPSRFQGPERPVEQVSWDDVQTFLGRLDAVVPGVAARLPSEAEWEYACRAGTDTPFWFGANITPDQVNYNGHYPYAGGAKGAYREQTVDVQALPANGWGLYQMHGNVWEWCQDRSGAYPPELVIDPVGAATGGGRVVRGGGWFNHAGLCRAAQRNAGHPGARYDYRGFRLARGPDRGPAEPG